MPTRPHSPTPVGRVGVTPEAQADGKIIGGDGNLYNPSAQLDRIPKVEPRQGVTSKDTTIDVHMNGVNTNAVEQLDAMQAQADAKGEGTLGLHNSTYGLPRDAAEFAGDRFLGGAGFRSTPATAVTTMMDAQNRLGQGVDFQLHSQAAEAGRRGLNDARQNLLDSGMTPDQVDAITQRSSVTTFGGAANRSPEGVPSLHHVNTADPVSSVFGMGSPSADPGPNGTIKTFTDVNNRHSFIDGYVPNVFGKPAPDAPVPAPKPDVTAAPTPAPAAPVPAPNPDVTAAPMPAPDAPVTAQNPDVTAAPTPAPDAPVPAPKPDVTAAPMPAPDAPVPALKPDVIAEPAPVPAAPAPEPAPAPAAPAPVDPAAQKAKEQTMVNNVVSSITKDMQEQSEVSGNDAARYAAQLKNVSAQVTDPGLKGVIDSLHGKLAGQNHISSDNLKSINSAVAAVESETGSDVNGDNSVGSYTPGGYADRTTGAYGGSGGSSNEGRSFSDGMGGTTSVGPGGTLGHI